jgi:hypothetical protein
MSAKHPHSWVAEAANAGRLMIHLMDHGNMAEAVDKEQRRAMDVSKLRYNPQTGEDIDSGKSLAQMLREATGITDEQIDAAINRVFGASAEDKRLAIEVIHRL